MVEYTIVKRIAKIKEWGSASLELNIVKWGKNQPKYDLRRWEGDTPGKGVTMTAEDMENLFYAIDEELELTRSEDGPPTEPVLAFRQEEIDYRNIFVHGNGKCGNPEHNEQEAVIAVLQVLKSNMSLEDVEVEVRFCPRCNIYYMSESNYNRLKSRGRILCQLMSEEEYKNYKREKEYGDLKPQSILNMIGYNVNSRDGYSDEYRQQILAFGIESEIITRKDAIGYLSFFIRLNEGNPNLAEAIAKWRRDRDYLTGYTSSGIRKIKGGIIVIHK